MIIHGQSQQDLVVTPTGLLFLGRRFACRIGRGRISCDKREGDGATPAGVHRIMGGFYRPDRLAKSQIPPWARPISLGDLWSDDSEDAHYNQHVRAPYPHSHEILRRADPLYDLVLFTDWNWPLAVAGKGSAIFMHSWRRPSAPTAGCVALAPADLRWIACRVHPGVTRLIVPYFR